VKRERERERFHIYIYKLNFDIALNCEKLLLKKIYKYIRERG